MLMTRPLAGVACRVALSAAALAACSRRGPEATRAVSDLAAYEMTADRMAIGVRFTATTRFPRAKAARRVWRCWSCSAGGA